MTLRSLFSGIQDWLVRLVNGILDFDLTNTLIIIGVIFYIFYFIWMIKKGFKHVEKNYNKSNTIKKIGLISGYIFLIICVVVLPSLILIDVYIVN